jgi:ABC-type multidrug transport system fused ATPase/permease subunit
VVPAVLCGALFYGQFIKQLSRQHLDSLATSTHIAAERFGGIATVLSFGQKNAEIQRYSSVIEQAYVYARKVAIWEGGFLGTAI